MSSPGLCSFFAPEHVQLDLARDLFFEWRPRTFLHAQRRLIGIDPGQAIQVTAVSQDPRQAYDAVVAMATKVLLDVEEELDGEGELKEKAKSECEMAASDQSSHSPVTSIKDCGWQPRVRRKTRCIEKKGAPLYLKHVSSKWKPHLPS